MCAWQLHKISWRILFVKIQSLIRLEVTFHSSFEKSQRNPQFQNFWSKYCMMKWNKLSLPPSIHLPYTSPVDCNNLLVFHRKLYSFYENILAHRANFHVTYTYNLLELASIFFKYSSLHDYIDALEEKRPIDNFTWPFKTWFMATLFS